MRHTMDPIDCAVLKGMDGFLRVSRSGGMEAKESDRAHDLVKAAAELGYFSSALHQYGETILKVLERNAGPAHLNAHKTDHI